MRGRADAGQACWQPSASIDVLHARARMLQRLRDFFAEREVLEVETPLLSASATTDPAIESLRTRWSGSGTDAPSGQGLYLHSSPELPMKRLLAAGSGPIYQVCKVFRDGERGRRHHLEFSLLEWYRPGWSLSALIDEVADLLRVILDRPGLEREVLSYRQLFRDRLDVDPWGATPAALKAVARASGLEGCDHLELDRDGWLDLLMSQCLEPGLGRGCMTFVRDYPPSQAALARLREGDPSVAERVELYLEGMELANGFDELTDAQEQRARFEADQRVRRAAGQPVPPIDEAFLAALEVGMPASAGIALGLDRLLMCVLGAEQIDAVLAFPVERA
ncbi:EF-P lysine aminoacylase GenX [Lamprobacter modestohalophilus]|uniref:EF-P lysine aminoacylase GenX n=1 Tax=Lamprobacter modestohalophilus TaxID=1064514 RepID=A0A9X1B5K4_9GAMM|nr:EF-P lysine aminoacylase EpmA [Lamprobacter modestohalophilus]MBK1619951.1 EF-P lysine aminoacylase GenX [Lamprobacter modestohalophilus]